MIVIADMEGASGVSDLNRETICHKEAYPQNTLWSSCGRARVTSDVLAVRNAAIDGGIDGVILFDMYYVGCEESDAESEKLPEKV